MIVIDISDDTYKAVCNGCMLAPDVENVVNAIKNGTPLPEHHGDLIDADYLREDFKASKKISFAERMDISCIVDHSPTIIEAECTYKETGCGSCKGQLDCPIDEGGNDKVLEQELILDKIRAEITDCLKALDEIEKSEFNIYLPNEISARRLTYQQCLKFIDKYKAESEDKECYSCIHSEEQDGSNCYECVKGMADNFEAQPREDDNE